MNYQQAADTRKKGLFSAITDKLVAGQGIGSSVGGAISEKTQATVKGFKEKFDILNIAKTLTGGSNLAPALLGRLTGRKKEDIAYFAGAKNKKIGGLSSTKTNEMAVEVLGLIYREMVRTEEQRKIDFADAEEEKNKELEAEDTRNKQIIAALTGRKGPTTRWIEEKSKAKKEKKEKKETKQPRDIKGRFVKKPSAEKKVGAGILSKIGTFAKSSAGVAGGIIVAGIGGSLSISQAIAKGESAAGSYNAVNMGTKNNKIIPVKEKVNIEDMTVNQVMQRQSIKWGDPNESQKLFAVGKYQMIPTTLADAVKYMKIDGNQKLTGALQEKIFEEYLIGPKQPAIARYLNSPVDDPQLLYEAVRASSREWASIADPDKPGGMTSFYGSGNKASISVEQMKEYLRADRKTIQEKSRKSSESIPTQNVGEKIDVSSRQNKNLKVDLKDESAVQQKNVSTTNTTNVSSSNQYTQNTEKEDDRSAYDKKVKQR
jgi:hypothetical protein